MNITSGNSSIDQINSTVLTPRGQYVWSDGLTTVFVVNILLFGTAILLHLLGACLILITKTRNLSNQNIFLIHLSLTSIFNVILSGVAIYHKAFGKRFPPGYIFCYFVAYMSYILNLIMIAVDRLISVTLPFKYPSFITKVVVFVELLLLWILAVTYGLIMRYAGLINNVGYNKYASYVYNGFVVVFTSVAYLVIIVKAFFSRRSMQLQNQQKVKLRKFLVPFLIVATFFLFNFLPHAIATKVNVDKQYRRIFIIGLIGLNILNNVSDPIIYIFLMPKVRNKLIHCVQSVFCCCTKKANSDKVTNFSKKNSRMVSHHQCENDNDEDAINLNLLSEED